MWAIQPDAEGCEGLGELAYYSWMGLDAHQRDPSSALLSRPTTISDVVSRDQARRHPTHAHPPGDP